MSIGVNLSFAPKRWPEPEAWARIVREDMELDAVQFSFDLLDPWWPEAVRMGQASRVRAAAQTYGLEIHSAQIGIAKYTFNGLLHPEPELRAAAVEWWERAIEITAAIGASAVGGPLGALTSTSAAVPGERERIYDEVLGTIERLSRRAADAGLSAILVEPTPQAREIPATVEESVRLARDLTGRCPAPMRYVLDIGHALYQPLYGPGARLPEWLSAVGPHIGILHIQNTDFQSDSHWGWPDARASYDLAGFAGEVHAAGLDDVPVFLEVFYPFESADELVHRNAVSSVKHCIAELQGVVQ
ncbi:MAG TPA: TIM barrel protein [Gaiellales bacterium]|jgi:sugar phosphate isomerase/epimerase